MSQAQYLSGYDDGYADAIKRMGAPGQNGGLKSKNKLYCVGGFGDMPKKYQDLFTSVPPDYNFKRSELPAILCIGGNDTYMPIVEGDPGSSYDPGSVVLLVGKTGMTPISYDLEHMAEFDS